MRPDLIALMARQHGRCSREQALHLGESPRSITGRLAEDERVEILDEVYAVAGSPETELARLWQVRLRVRSVRFSRRTAAYLLRVPGAHDLTIVEGIVPGTCRAPKLPGADLRRAYDFGRRGEVAVHGLPATPRLETTADLGAVYSTAQLLAVVQDAVFHGVLSLEQLEHRLGRGRRGAARLRVVIEILHERKESILTVMAFDILVAAGLPEPACGVEVVLGLGDVDLWYELARYALEPRGFGPHGRQGQWYADVDKVETLADHGITVGIVTWKDVTVFQGRFVNRVSRRLAVAGMIPAPLNYAPTAIIVPKYARRAA
jgi:hypothetical protein